MSMGNDTNKDRGPKMEALLDELALLVDGDRDVIARHADFLADDDDARDLRHEAGEIADRVSKAGADFVVPADLETKLLAALDARGDFAKTQPDGRNTEPGFVLDPHARAEIEKGEAQRAETGAETDGAERASGQREVSGDKGQPSTERRATAKTVALETGRELEPGQRRTPTGVVIALVATLGIAAAAVLGVIAVGGAFTAHHLATREGGPDPDPGPVTAPIASTTGRISQIVRGATDGASGVEIQIGGQWTAASAEAELPAGSSIRTDDRTRARVLLSDGSELVLNHSTELHLDDRAPRRFELPRGEVLADIAHLADGPRATFTVPTGDIEVLGTKFVLSASPEIASVRVTRGNVRVHASGASDAAEVKQGEEGVLRAGVTAAEVTPVMDMARAMAWAALENESNEEAASTLPGIGSLRARRPGEREDRERPLFVSRQDVRVRISGNVARTEIEQVFRNDSEQVLEGTYRFPLPSDAQIARLALDVDGQLVEGSFVARERARRIWAGVIRNATPVSQRRREEEFIWVPGPWRDPALLEWQRGGQFELRIFPIPARGERRVVLAYTQVIPPGTAGRRYVYPLAHSRDESTRVGEMSFDVRVAGASEVRTVGYPLAAGSEASTLALTQRDFRPNGDLVIDYTLPERDRELAFWSYRGDAAQSPPERSRDRDTEVIELQRQIASDGRPYVAFALRPRLPALSSGESRDYVLVVDSSQSMVGERFQRASRLVLGMIAEMDRRDRFTVLACDYVCRSMEGAAHAARMRSPTASELQATSDWLGRVEPAGASDLLTTLRTASRAGQPEGQDVLTASPRSVHVVYVGDGVASVGHRSAGALASEAGRIRERQRVSITTVGIGADADGVALAAIARSGGGHYVPFVPGQRSSLAAISVLETTYGTTLREASLTLPEGLTDIAPAALPTIRSGEEVIVVARMARPDVSGDVVLRGTVGGESFEQRYPVQIAASSSAGNLFVPALWAARTIERLELEGRGENEARIVALSKAYSVMSRHTSLLVLESEEMFRAFGIDRNDAPAPQWTGEEEAEEGGAEAALALADPLADADAAAANGVLGTLGGGSGFGGLAGAGSGARGRSGAGDDEIQERGRRAEQPQAAAPAPSEPAEAPMAEARDTRNGPARRPAPPPVTVPFPRGPGQWMRRVWYRVGAIETDGTPSFREQEAARLAEESLRLSPDSRDRHRAAVRALARIGSLERALEVAEAWFARDRQDPEALVARADVLARMGRRDESLRVLTGVVDLRADDVALQERLANAFERAGDSARACAHRVSLADIRREDAERVAAAVRCERVLEHRELADLVLASVRDARVRDRAARAAQEPADLASTPRGDLMLEASWSGGEDDVDLAIITPDGTRISWMGGRTTVVGRDATTAGRETLGLRSATVGSYIIEISRTNESEEPITGQVRIRAFDAGRTVSFRLDEGTRVAVARAVVRRESRLEPAR